MEVTPVYAAVGSFFKQQPRFWVPKYQRTYAWDKLEIDDFLQDLEKCFQKRKANTPINHFFGGIVSVEKQVEGTVSQSAFELVDGQQRMATFVLLAASIISVYKELLIEAQNSGDSSNERIIARRIQELTERFIEYELEVNRITHIVRVLQLSNVDDLVFRDLVRRHNPNLTRDSHEKLKYAYDQLLEKVINLSNAGTLNDRLDNLEIFKDLLDADFSLIHIKTKDKREAYVLFTVLNDRGKSLTDGDLLRAKTLELLEGHPSQQSSVENIWDAILADPSNTTGEYLRWIYASFKGARPGANTLFDDFLDVFYPQHQQTHINSSEADFILRRTQEIHKEIENCRKLITGEWPFTPARPITTWDINRLALLTKELRLTVTMPLLLAACHLDQRKFSEIVQILERFMFRFKVIGNQHVTPVINIMHSEALDIRNASTAYNITTLKTRLHTLQLSKVNDTVFRSQLDSLVYKDGGGNQPLKYFLMTIEYYLRWYDQGAAGEPNCMDKTRVYDFAGTTIEHIYPKNTPAASVDAALEPLKNTLGNLTFLGPTDNELGGNDNFSVKKPIFQNSSVFMNQKIAQNTQWTVAEVNARVSELKDMACAIFNI